MTKNELKSLVISQLNEMTETELDLIANEVVSKLSEDEIKALSPEVKKKLKISKSNLELWVTLIIVALIMSLIQLATGK